MEISEYKNVFENERSHFFYVSTHYLVIALAKKYLGKRGGEAKILDAGCGTGGLAKKLTSLGGSVNAIDVNKEALRLARKNGVVAKQASVNKLPFADNIFDLVTSIDVIYHRQVDDRKALAEMARVLKTGGHLILRVPANRFLMSAHDSHVHTARRYDKRELAKKLRQAGLKIKFISYVHAPIFPLSLIRVLFEKLDHRPSASTVGRVNPIINTTLTAMLKLEAIVLASGIKMPFGQGLIAVATKKG